MGKVQLTFLGWSFLFKRFLLLIVVLGLTSRISGTAVMKMEHPQSGEVGLTFLGWSFPFFNVYLVDCCVGFDFSGMVRR